jgi:serine/threonine protein kinase
MPYALTDFARDFWKSTSITRDTKMLLLREPLEGLKSLHDLGIMHRDVRRQNMLIISITPPRASLCDYGKAIETKGSTMTRIGPICTLAPEVWTTAEDGPYSSKIDTWAYGYAIAEILGYSNHGNTKITPSEHSLILRYLRTQSATVIEDQPLIDLATKLLAWKAADRWSAAEALEHECWSSAIAGMEESPQDHVRDEVEVESVENKKVRRESPKLQGDGKL